VRTSVATIVAGPESDDNAAHHENCNRQIIIFSLRGVVRFAGSERLTRAIVHELEAPVPDDPGSGRGRDACAVVLSLREVFSLSPVAQRVIHEDIFRLVADGKLVVAIDPADILRIDREKAGSQLRVVKSDVEARHSIGGVGCQAVAQSNGW
jgi:hypothetical protein